MVTWKAELTSTEENPLKSRVSVRWLPGTTQRKTKTEPTTTKTTPTTNKTIKRELKALLFLKTIKSITFLYKKQLFGLFIVFHVIASKDFVSFIV